MNKGLEVLERAKKEHSALNNGFPDIEYLTQIDQIAKRLIEKENEEELIKQCHYYGIKNAQQLEKIIEDYNNYVCLIETLDYFLKTKNRVEYNFKGE